jgi:hypothetical protein
MYAQQEKGQPPVVMTFMSGSERPVDLLDATLETEAEEGASLEAMITANKFRLLRVAFRNLKSNQTVAPE